MMMASLPTPPTMNPPNGPGIEAVDMRATNATGGPPQPGRPWTPRVPLHTIYALPVPIRTFPLPSFYPNNPISLAHLAYAWLRQVLFPPAAEVYVGVWDPSTRSIHITDPKSIRALWEQGFFGKGNLSRSEPNWLKRELGRRGAARGGNVSEERTESRRQERANAKWERAKAELEVIEQQRLEERAGLEAIERQRPEEAGLKEARLEEATPEQPQLVAASPVLAPLLPRKNLAQGPKPPVGPLELLALPNSLGPPATQGPLAKPTKEHKAPVGPAELLALPNSLASLSPKLNKLESRSDSNPSLPTALSHELLSPRLANGHVNGKLPNGHAHRSDLVHDINGSSGASASSSPLRSVDSNPIRARFNDLNGTANGYVSPARSVESTDGSNGPNVPGDKENQPLKRRKSVRFSPQVESTTFQYHDPPSPGRLSGGNVSRITSSVLMDATVSAVASPPIPTPEPTPQQQASARSHQSPIILGELVDKEHFQLAPEEAFFLVFAIGALSVIDPVTLAPVPADRLLELFRSNCYFPPRRIDSSLSSLGPDDPFLVNYAVYHHFRSLGWVVRHGIKFGVDWILYQRGPVFDHSEFGLIVLPSFSDKEWSETEHQTARKSWSWLMGVNRVLANVLKSLVLVYVDIPPPSVFEKAMKQGGMAAALKKYTIREVMVRRFSVNRNR